MYLQCHGSQQSTDTSRAKHILFYALWVLYALSAATGMIDILALSWTHRVGMDDHRCLTLFQLVVQNIEIAHHLEIIGVTIFAYCDFTAQFILVRTTGNIAYHLLYSSNSSKDISLLDYVGLLHSCCDRSFMLSICVLRSIILSSFTD